MKITLSPIIGKSAITLAKHGDTLTINGEDFDFSQLGNNETLPREAFGNTRQVGPVERDNTGVLHIRVRFPIGHLAGESARFPDPIHVTKDGPIHLPDPGHEPKEASA